MLLSYILILSSVTAYNKLIKKANFSQFTKGILTLMTSVVTIMILSSLSVVQLKYIKEYEIPPLRACVYYDQYDNLIYSSQFDFICPNLDNVENKFINGKEVLTFNVTEKAFGKATEYISVGEDWGIKKYYKTSVMNNEFEYVYYFKGFIEKVIITSRTLNYKDEEEQLYNSSGYKRIVENHFTPNLITSVQTTFSYNLDINSQETKNSYTPDFDELEPEVVTYTSSLTPIENSDTEYYIDLSEIKMDNGNQVIDVYGKGNVTFSNYPEILINGYDNDRYNNHNINYRFLYDEIRVKREAPPAYNEREREGTFVYKNNLLSSYTRLVENNETGLDVEIKHYKVNSDLLAVNHLVTTKMIDTHFGKKVEYYWTYKDRDGKYGSISNHGETYSSFQLSMNLMEMNDYKLMVFDYTHREDIDFYQFNPLVEGFEHMHGELYYQEKDK
jgi:hypothetical protein